MLETLDIDATEAIVEARQMLEAERCAVWVPSAFDNIATDDDLRTLREIRAIREANATLRAALHAKADRLPRGRWVVYRDILEASSVLDHDSAALDVAYRAWVDGGMRGKRPTSMVGAMIDAFNEGNRRSSCLYEAFSRATRNAKGWRDLYSILPVLSEALGVTCVLPDDVICRHVAQDAENDAANDREE